MKKLLLPFALFVFHFCQAQDYTVVYQMEIVAKPMNFITHLKTYLEGNGLESLYEEDFEGSRAEAPEEGTHIAIGENWTFYKDLKKHTCFYTDDIKFKKFEIKDTLRTIDWKIATDTKIIAGYNCQRATCVYRGRSFEVFFAKNIPVSDGPWKLFGLPGLILEANSDDDVAGFHIKAEKVSFEKVKKKYTNPYLGKDLLSFEQFRQIYREKYEEFLYKIVTPDGETRPLPKGFREYFVD